MTLDAVDIKIVLIIVVFIIILTMRDVYSILSRWSCHKRQTMLPTARAKVH